MNLDVLLVALIGATPPTIAAVATFRHAKGANRATNQAPAGEPRLVERAQRIEERQTRMDERQTRMELRQVAQETAISGIQDTVDDIRISVRSIVDRLIDHD
ncbi:MAG: hypothetical protein AAGA17_00095 [Actinomycetota bacterium]